MFRSMDINVISYHIFSRVSSSEIKNNIPTLQGFMGLFLFFPIKLLPTKNFISLSPGEKKNQHLYIVVL